MTPTALCCPDKFRGSLTAAEAAAAMAAGLRAGGVTAVELALADGGEGTLDVLLSARKGRRLETRVSGPLGAPVDAEWGLLADGTAVIEMARASGLALTRGRNDPSLRSGFDVVADAVGLRERLDGDIEVMSLTERAGSSERAIREAAALVRDAASELRVPERVA